ncbi:hypothetical protein Pmar_PMAR002588 [Perkinsus marinus ATCC 50983]|uniref:DUF4371 domain-containing protein n=1 Tax=Perkinsus marinus (strain ATCC 50983 / TXsc) TaxID=423536 RepID=C5KAE8_PERM5|nr:hypothetical protein Pmar_PMAR002588 [Perkinsus marinus ATCC 50983]EER18546.1 hypothetical protein Pmar_PMAR002588 [Perkinsus marinus ATCC 50983]|eukprot:XP_002786750.1 hypothetical protein Pmar_PMAR002588 [Perkinsus marinus ATCC 50983]
MSSSSSSSSSSNTANCAFDIMMKRAHEGNEETAQHAKRTKILAASNLPEDIAKSKSDEPCQPKSGFAANAQGRPFQFDWSHFEGGESDNRGNFLELMRLLSEFDKVTASRLAEGPRNAVYLSPQIQNSLLKSMASLIVKDIVEEVGDQPYCLLGDETRDEGGTEQLALCIRYSKLEKIGDPLVIQESFLGFISLENLDSSAIVDRLIHRLDSIALDASRCTSQGYDGASDFRYSKNEQDVLLRICIVQTIG